MQHNNISSLPIVNKAWKLIWILTKSNAIRNSIYKPNLDKNWKLNLAVALWINNFLEKTEKLINSGINIFILDTAHGFQKTMIEAIKKFRKKFWNKVILVAGNVMTSKWTEALLSAWANGVKVGIWPGAMCTTRMMTWVGRPQFSAVLDCSKKARELWWFVIADWWVRNPRDLALSIVAWATNVMMWTILAWTFESTWDIFYDSDWNMYKKNYWMASLKAVNLRNSLKSDFEIARKEFFVEWISDSKIFLRKWYKSVWQVVDKFCSWLKSSMTYVWAKNLEEFYKKAIVWVQSSAGFFEGTPHWKILRNLI
jgi:IMP dehydrogenase